MIAHAVASESWHLYQTKANGQEEEIDQHPVLDLLAKVNPFSTHYEFMYLQTLYLILVGESFTVLDFTRGRLPGQMWPAIPQQMQIKRDKPTDYISRYEYQAGATKISLEIPEVIHIKNPNPMNPLRGIGPAQAIGVDLAVERYATNYQQKLFYNDAMPGLMLEFPDTPPPDERERLKEEWKKTHEGWQNARKTAFLWGGAKANTVTMTNRELDFWKSAQGRGDKILAVLGVPKIVAGIPEGTNRATAEAAQYIFARYTVLPILTQMKEALNEQLLPLYPDSQRLRLDHSDPVPENREAIVSEVERMIRCGIMTREEGRQRLGLDPKPTKGETFLMPGAILPQPAKQIRKPLIKRKSRLFPTEERKEAYWREWVAKTEKRERLLIKPLQEMFDTQAKEALKRLRAGVNPDALINLPEAIEVYEEIVTPILRETMIQALEDAVQEVERWLKRSVSKQDEPIYPQDEPIYPGVEWWLRTRIGWAAREIGEESARLLADTLAIGIAAGEGMDDLAARVKQVFKFNNEVRALRIARTETIQAQAEGELQGYEEAGVEEVEFFTALDERVCPDCEGLHGQRFPINEAHGIITVHPNCRCNWLPVVE